MDAVTREYDYLIRRATKEGDYEKVKLLREAQRDHLENATAPDDVSGDTIE